MLKKTGDEISLLNVFEAIEGPFPSKYCLLESPICSIDDCILGELLKTVDRQVYSYLSKTMLTDVTYVIKSILH